MKISIFLVVSNLLIHLTLFQTAFSQARISVEPQNVLIETASDRHLLSFDLKVENPGAEAMRLAKIAVLVFDRRGNLQMRKFLESSGIRHGDYEILRLEPKASAFIFNPFDEFAPSLELAELRYDFTFETGENDKVSTQSVTVKPVIFSGKTRLSIPLKGRVLVHDGHDFYAHHRRFNLAHPFLKEIGITKNFTRYASDFVIVNERGNMRKNVDSSNEDWYGFGATLNAPGAGRVIRARNTVNDNIDGKSTFTLDDFRKDSSVPAGNFILIDHLNGEFSFLAHCKKGSITVKEGDVVRAGQPIAQLGVSGDAELPHLHYELRNSGEVNADGLPAYFHNFVRLLGTKRISISMDSVNSGDILEVR